jgi:hypothetical protein
MKKSSGDLSPRERIEAALKLHEMESPGSPISIATICAQASVSRANLYERHPDLIKRIRGPAKEAETRTRATATVASLKSALAAERKKTSALYLYCVELQAEIQRLKARAVLDGGRQHDTGSTNKTSKVSR